MKWVAIQYKLLWNELPYNMNYYEMSLGDVIQWVFEKINCFNKIIGPDIPEVYACLVNQRIA